MASKTSKHRTLAILTALLGVTLLAVALFALVEMLRDVPVGRIFADVRTIPFRSIVLAGGLTILTYLVMSGYDLLGIRYAGGRLPAGRVIAAAFVGDAFNNCLGLSAILGSSVRYRFYSAWGLSATQIAKTIGIFTVSYWMGFSLLGGLLLSMGHEVAVGFVRMPGLYSRSMGFLMLGIAGMYLSFVLFRKQPLKILKWHIEIPSGRLALGLLCVAILDWVLAATVFFILLPYGTGISYIQIIALYVLAHLAGMISQLPAGIAVFEAVSLATLTTVMPVSQAAALLLIFRALFYILPFCISLGVMGLMEALHVGKLLRPVAAGTISNHDSKPR